MKRTILLALLLACVTTQATDWISLGKDDQSRLEFFIDGSSIKVKGDVRRAWFKFVSAPHTEHGTGTDAHKWVTHRLIRQAFNCSEETQRIEAGTFYFEDGTDYVVDYSEPSPWIAVPPESIGSAEMKFICAVDTNK